MATNRYSKHLQKFGNSMPWASWWGQVKREASSEGEHAEDIDESEWKDLWSRGMSPMAAVDAAYMR